MKAQPRRRGRGVRVCIEDIVEPHPSNRRGVPLSTAFFEIAQEWCYKKNCGFGPEDFSYGSKVVVWWQCPVSKAHVYDMAIQERTGGKSNCPYCAGKRVTQDNSLAELEPSVADSWHPTKNGKLTPRDFTAASSKKKIWWMCQEGHSWQATVKDRTQGRGCPHCYDSRCLNLRNFPKMLKLFDRKRNKELGLTPERLTTKIEVWWKCPAGPDHLWFARFNMHNDELRCPYCTWHRVSKTNNLEYLYPELAKEYHPTKNGKLKAKDIPAQRNIKVWWKCAVNQRHIWQASVRNRTMNKSGCPKCWAERRSETVKAVHLRRRMKN